MRLRVPSPPLGWAHSMLVVAVVAVPIALRLWLLHEKQLEFAGADLLGLSADAAVGALVAILLLQLARWSRIAVAVLATGWVFLSFANYEHVRVFDAAGSLNYVGYVADPVFLRGSVLHASHPWLLGLTLVSLFGSAKRWSGWRPRPLLGRWTTVGAFALVAVAALQPLDDRYLPWRQNHFLLINLRSALEDRATPPVPSNEDPAVALGPLEADLSGQPRFAFASGKKRNVIVVLVESLSGAYLPSQAEDEGVASSVRTPRLDARATKALRYTNFIAHQRQTNRGEYSTLCGDLDRLTTAQARMSEIAQGGHRTCLPQILREAGYGTAYLQASPLAFMMKDQFMKRIGFDQVLGTEHFATSYARNQWGIDDRAFFEQSMDVVRQLRSGGRPFFLAMLTVGTHHPYLVPGDFRSPGAGLARAMDYADDAVTRFLHALQREGVLEDTLVLVTADESAGVSEGDDIVRTLTQNWIPLVVFTPEAEPRGQVVKDVYGQSDLALSVLDYLGLAEHRGELMGRSIFRRYAEERPVYFSNTYTQQAWVLEPGGMLSRCNEKLGGCVRFGVDRTRPFHPIRRQLEMPPATLGRWQQVLAWNDRALATPDPNVVRTFPLSVSDKVDIVEALGQQIVFGGQYLTVPRGSRIDVELELEVSGDGALLELEPDLIAPGIRPHRPRVPLLGAGDRAKVRWEYVFDEERDHVEVRMHARKVSPAPTQLHLKKATMRVVPRGALGRRPGGRQLELTIERSGRFQDLRFTTQGPARFRNARCVRGGNGDRRLIGRSCGAGHLLFGPWAWLPPGATLRARFDVVVLKGETDLVADVVSGAGGRKHANTAPVHMRAGDRRTVEISFTAREAVEGIEARLENRPVGKQADIDILSAVLDISSAERSP